MSLISFSSSLSLHFPHNLTFLQRAPLQIREFHVWQRKRPKTRKLAFRCQLGPLTPDSFEDVFWNLVSFFPFVNPVCLIPPTLGFAAGAAGAALYLSQLKPRNEFKIFEVGEWILLTNQTPFNRFTFLRCPSIFSRGCELIEDVHFLRQRNYGKIMVRGFDDTDGRLIAKQEYQRVCIATGDGGVISLDWPANLELEEHGLDTTLLLVPGTVEGSRDQSVRSFVGESLKHGCFPVVMNPRGCSGSPLTTARLFTAADSDDICTAIQFINRARQGTTLMGVGWGYGANMLTKYLAEVGAKTPLLAATCIDNPFDLGEPTRCIPHQVATDQKLVSGLVDILRSNKELFEGRTKGFNVEKALLAKSVCEFENSISMVAYGYDSIEDFYSKSSTRDMVGNVKIPLLFIENDDGMVPLSSIPYSMIAENPFTSLLLCSYAPSSLISGAKYSQSWCQNLTLEWLAAVEIGLLKGHHPLLNHLDVSINLSKDPTIAERRSDEVSGVRDQNPRKKLQIEHKEMQKAENATVDKFNSSHEESTRGGEIDLPDDESGQAMQTAQVVINMLDVTIPDTLTEEQKKKVLTAVNQGQTLMKALQDDVPEDVREKLMGAVSGILHSQNTCLHFDRLLSIQGANVSSGLKSYFEEVGGSPNEESSTVDCDVSDQIKKDDNMAENYNHSCKNKPAEGIDSEPCPSEKSEKPLGRREEGNSQNIEEKDSDSSTHQEKAISLGQTEEMLLHQESSSGIEFVEQKERPSEKSEKPLGRVEERNAQNVEEKDSDSSTHQNIAISLGKRDEMLLHQESSSGIEFVEQKENDDQMRENEITHPASDQNNSIGSDSGSAMPTVSQSLNALTEIDDSTQVAVKSVFGVIEDVITQLEGGNSESEVKARNDTKDEKIGSISENDHVNNGRNIEREDESINLFPESSIRHDSLEQNHYPNYFERQMNKEPTRASITIDGSIGSSRGCNTSAMAGRGKVGKMESTDLKKHSVMLGAVTAALGASALLAQQQDGCKDVGVPGSSPNLFVDKENYEMETEKLEAQSGKMKNNIVTSIAEKAMTVAGPVMPTKENGKVDQDRLVAMLADMGHKGGLLRLVGKIALLWGGIRGAMSLTDRLISFLHIAERPLFQRILAFFCLVVVLWSPVVAPLLPTLVQSWALHSPSRFSEMACVVGLYSSVLILVMLWGKRIRGHENPLQQYGLDIKSPIKIQNLLGGLVGGVMLVLSIQSIKAFMGFVHFSWPASLCLSSPDVMSRIKAYARLLLLAGRGIVAAAGVAFVEELLFRSWLPEEIATNLGYHHGIVISGLVFSLLQRSPEAIPGLWVLSLALAEARKRSQGNLCIPIGLRAGIMATSFFLQAGGFLTHGKNYPLWLAGTHPLQPFSGVVGLVFSLILALILYSRYPPHQKKPAKAIC